MIERIENYINMKSIIEKETKKQMDKNSKKLCSIWI